MNQDLGKKIRERIGSRSPLRGAARDARRSGECGDSSSSDEFVDEQYLFRKLREKSSSQKETRFVERKGGVYNSGKYSFYPKKETKAKQTHWM